MELRQLSAFAAVVRTGTFRAAAAEIHLTQPALWKQVRSLQDELGVVLFERAGRRVRLTRAGAELLERAAAVLDGAQRLGELATALRAGSAGIVSIATPAPPVQHLLAAAIGAFARSHPGVPVELIETSAPLAALESARADLAVAPRAPGLPGFRLFDVHVVALAGPGHRLARRRRIDAADLRGQPLLVSPRGSLSRRLLEGACRGWEPAVRMESASPAMLVALATHGLGVAVVASDALAGAGPVRPCVVTDRGAPLATEVWVHWRDGAGLGAAARAFVDALRARVGSPAVTTAPLAHAGRGGPLARKPRT